MYCIENKIFKRAYLKKTLMRNLPQYSNFIIYLNTHSVLLKIKLVLNNNKYKNVWFTNSKLGIRNASFEYVFVLNLLHFLQHNSTVST